METKHESFGQISFSRVNCSQGVKFYGSELKQDHYIQMEVHQSEMKSELSNERYYTRGVPLVNLRMSSNQFSELITSLNMGSGIPCTLEWLDGRKLESLPELESRKEFAHNEFKKRMSDFARTLKSDQLKAKELVKKKTLSKDDQHELNMLLEKLTQEVESNIPFFAKTFQETMDKVVVETKQEVENAIQHKIITLGLDALHSENKLLGGE